MAVVDYTSQVTIENIKEGTLNNKICLETDEHTVTFCISGTLTASGDVIIANIPTNLTGKKKEDTNRVKLQLFFLATNLTKKTVTGCRVNSSGTIIMNNAIAGDNYWIGATYVKF